MSRRPREAAQQPGRGGEGWRLRWSESAIPRVATRRVRMVGTFTPTPPTYVQTDQKIPYSLTTWELNTAGYVPDPMTDYVVCWTYSDQTITPPSGWTTLASGSHGPVNYWVGWAPTSVSDWTLSWGGATDANGRLSHIVTSWWNGGNLVPVASVDVTAASASSAALPQPDPAWLSTRQALWMNKADSDYTYYKYATYNATLQNYPYTRDQFFNVNEIYGGNVSFYSDSARTIPKNIDYYIGLVTGWKAP